MMTLSGYFCSLLPSRVIGSRHAAVVFDAWMASVREDPNPLRYNLCDWLQALCSPSTLCQRSWLWFIIFDALLCLHPPAVFILTWLSLDDFFFFFYCLKRHDGLWWWIFWWVFEMCRAYLMAFLLLIVWFPVLIRVNNMVFFERLLVFWNQGGVEWISSGAGQSLR